MSDSTIKRVVNFLKCVLVKKMKKCVWLKVRKMMRSSQIEIGNWPSKKITSLVMMFLDSACTDPPSLNKKQHRTQNPSKSQTLSHSSKKSDKAYIVTFYVLETLA